ncbi:MAG: hypothetical protein ACR2LN_06725 [Candidatus Levyibacteriota bacterium]
MRTKSKVESTEKVIPEGLRPTSKLSLREIIIFLRHLTQKEQWSLIRQELEKAVDIISLGKAVMFFLVDETAAGGSHTVKAFYNPRAKKVLLEIPKEPLQKGGRFPTVLHALEIIVGAIDLANKRRKRDQKIPYPEISFVKVLKKSMKKSDVSVIPLTVAETKKANIIAFHPQARHIDPETLARAYYHIIQTDNTLPRDLIRHTMLVQTLSGNRPRDKHSITVTVLPKDATQVYKLIHPGRITRWFNPNAVTNIVMRRA